MPAARLDVYLPEVPTSPLCRNPACHEPDRAGPRKRGLCSRCYAAVLATGERELHRIEGPLEERLYPRLTKGDVVPPHAPWLLACYPWIGATDVNGYGSIWVGDENGDTDRVHRVVYELEVGPIPPGYHVDHLCHHPDYCQDGPKCLHRRCGRATHLQAVPPAVNNARSGSVTALNAAKSHCKRGHLLDGANLIMRDGGRRECRACKLLRAAGALPGAGQLGLFEEQAGRRDICG